MEQTKQSIVTPCPVCGSENNVSHLFLEDYFLTREKFSIIKCQNCGLLVTQPQPEANIIKKYYNSTEYISHSVESASLVDRVYGFVRKRTVKSKINLVNKFAQGNNLLDIGCATGVFLDACRNHGYLVEGIEPSEKARHFANEYFNLKVHDLSYLSNYQPGSFDVITMWHVLEHVDDINERMKVLHKLIKDDGVLFIALPNPLSYDASYYKEYWAAYDVPRHLYHFTQDALKKLAQKHSFKVIKVFPMHFDSFYISLLSEKYKNGSASYIKAAYRGLVSNISAMRNDQNYSSLIYVIKKS